MQKLVQATKGKKAFIPIHIIRDTFLAYFKPPTKVSFGDTGAEPTGPLGPPRGVTGHFYFSKPVSFFVVFSVGLTVFT